MKKLLILLTLIYLLGCARMIPARAKELEPGKFKLMASGNIFASISSLEAKIDKRAKKLCGEENYTYLDKEIATPHSPAYSNGVDIGASYTVVTRTIQCNP